MMGFSSEIGFMKSNVKCYLRKKSKNHNKTKQNSLLFEGR